MIKSAVCIQKSQYTSKYAVCFYIVKSFFKQQIAPDIPPSSAKPKPTTKKLAAITLKCLGHKFSAICSSKSDLLELTEIHVALHHEILNMFGVT